MSDLIFTPELCEKLGVDTFRLEQDMVKYGLSGIKTTLNYDHTDDKLRVGKEQDVTAILERNERLRNDHSRQSKLSSGDAIEFANVPITVLEMFKTEYGIDYMNDDHMEGLMKLLNDPDLRGLRTTNGTI